MKLLSVLLLCVILTSACAPAPAAVPVTGNNTDQSTVAVTAASQNQATAPQLYTVRVGAEDTTNGAAIEAYFPAELHIHVGDTVLWKSNSMEIHTVTFQQKSEKPLAFVIPLPNGPAGAMMFNPQVAFPTAPKDGKYGGSTYANSGIMGKEQGQAPEFRLTFTQAGEYAYTCVVHQDEKMVGKIVVEPASASVPSPTDAQAQGDKEIASLMAQVPQVLSAANKEVAAPEHQANGTTLYHVTVGYSQGQFDLMAFFPNKLAVKEGDQVQWTFSKMNMAPHTITFLNGAAEPETVAPIPQPNGPPLLSFNPELALPKNADQPLTNQGMFNSGLIDPQAPGPHQFTLTIGHVSGDLAYLCLLHDMSGMKGVLTVTSK
jgi:plastocyanin